MDAILKRLFEKWVEEYEQVPREPLGPRLSELLLHIFAQSKRDPSFTDKYETNDMYRYLKRKSEESKLQIDLAALVWLTFICETIEDTLINIAYIKHLQLQGNGYNPFTMQHVIVIYSSGILSRETLDELWEDQKIGNGGDLLDDLSFLE